MRIEPSRPRRPFWWRIHNAAVGAVQRRSMTSTLPRALLLSCLTVVAGCHPRNVRAPYLEAPPTPTALLRGFNPPISALQVPRAKIRQRAGSATLMFSAQRPDRFVGTVQIAGNELVSIALRPDRYELRQPSGPSRSRGFYEGTPSPCAIQALLGVPMEPSALISMLLGDAPVIVASEESMGASVQRWERAYPGHELLILEDERLRQELRFRWISGAWQFAGTAVHRRQGDRWVRVFEISHRDFESFGQWQLATRVDITSVDANGDSQTVKIHLLDVVVDPSALTPDRARATDRDGGGTPPPIDTWDDDWADDDTDEPATPSPNPDDRAPATPLGTESAEIPAIFFLSAGGLQPRGDLCRTPDPTR